ncbi:MAG TPA: hypothetical protein VJC07_04515 [Candidatus Nanoarchaeia archaeon]|nr:hypothetical protein [Candidatus Nanoarchaeia archaeon]
MLWLIIPLVAFCSVIIAGYIRNFTQEELAEGERYFKILQIILSTSIAILLLFKLQASLPVIASAIVGIATAHFLKEKWLYLGISMVASLFISLEWYALIASLIFIYGLPYGTRHTKVWKNLVLFLLPFAFFFLKGFATEYSSIIAGFVAGSLLLRE